MHRLFFLSGYPRSGATLLSALLNQRSDFHVSVTSGLLDLMIATETSLQDLGQRYTIDLAHTGPDIHKSLAQGWYQKIDRPYCMDKNHGWVKNIAVLREVIDPEVRVVCTIRPMAQVVASFLSLIKQDPDNIVDRRLVEQEQLTTDNNRVAYMWHSHLEDSVISLHTALRLHGNHLHLVNYDDLVQDPRAELDKIYEFLGLEPWHEHKFNDIQPSAREDDKLWGIKNLHQVRSTVAKTSTPVEQLLTADWVKKFAQIDAQTQLLARGPN